MDQRRAGNGYGPNAISHSEIEAWCRLTGSTLRGWEIAALNVMERERIAFLQPKDPKDPRNAPAITQGDFGKMFGKK